MTATALRGRPSPLPPDPRSGVAFQEACARRDYGLLQDALRDMSKRDAVDHLADIFPHRTRTWHHRNFGALMALDPDRFWRLMHPDPTGDTAAHNIDNDREKALP